MRKKVQKICKRYGSNDAFQSHPHKDQKEIICYECNNSDHIRPNCLKSKKKKRRKTKERKLWLQYGMQLMRSDNSKENNEVDLFCMALEKVIEFLKMEDIEVIEYEPPNI